MSVCQIDAKGQIIAEENYHFPRLGVESLGFGIRGTINDVWKIEWHKYLLNDIIK